MIMDATLMADRNLTPLLDSRFLPALNKVLSERKNAVALTRDQIRLFVNREIGENILTQQAWARIWNDKAGPEIKVSEYYQELRDIIELHRADAKVHLVSEVLEAENYLQMNRAQFLLNQIAPGISKEPSEGISVGNVTLIVNPPANLPVVPENAEALAASADSFADYELLPNTAKVVEAVKQVAQ